jgi:predicted ATPase
MMISCLKLKNWRNFLQVEIPLRDRVFILGPNASGKSNLLDVFRFLRDIAKEEGGGLQYAIAERGGLSRIRCLAARRYPDVEIEVHLRETADSASVWKYAIGLKQDNNRNPLLAFERVWYGDRQIIDRPDKDDKADIQRLRQTHLQQVNANKDFRVIAKVFAATTYVHLVPQLLRHPGAFSGGAELQGDPFGRNFLVRIAKTTERTRRAWLRKIEQALIKAVPQLKQLTDITDESGAPHLEAVYQHWRRSGAKQREDQFSDGTLRLIGLFWSLLEDDSLLLLEEPELSLHSAIIGKLPELIYSVQRARKRQIIMSTHSPELLADKSIGGESVIVLKPSAEGTSAELAASIPEIRALLESGLSVADAVLPLTVPDGVAELRLFE